MIILCEPIARSYEHAPFNAALIILLLKAFPEQNILFFAEKNHQKEVRSIIAQNETALLPRVTYKTGLVFEDQEGMLRRHKRTVDYLKTLHAAMRTTGSKKLIFCAASANIILALKFLAQKEYKYYLIIHSLAEKVKNPAISRRFWRFIFNLRFLLSFASRPELKYIVLGEYIRQNLLAVIPALKPYLFSIDHPALFKTKATERILENKEIRFVSPGVARFSKNSHLYFNLAQDLSRSSQGYNLKFYQAGPLADLELYKYVNKYVKLQGDKRPLSRAEYDRCLAQADYVVLLYPTSAYAYTASGVFFDALSQLKPIIALRTAAFNYYFQRFGQLGYLYDTYEDLKSGLLQMVNQKNHSHYAKILKNMERAKRELSISALLPRARKIFA